MTNTLNVLSFLLGFPTFAEYPSSSDTTSDSKPKTDDEYTMVMKKDIKGCKPHRQVVFKDNQIIHPASGKCVIATGPGIEI